MAIFGNDDFVFGKGKIREMSSNVRSLIIVDLLRN